MAEYTIELRDVVRHNNIFAFNYPFYDEKKRTEFEQAFIRHFYFREICCPSIDRFRVYLEDKFTTVFPYYNELMKTALIDYDVENPYKLTETYTRKTDSLGKSNGVSSTVGSVKSEENGESQTNNVNDKTEQQRGTATDTQQDTGTSKTVDIKKTDTEKDTSTIISSETTDTQNKKHTQKYLDTPQGLTDLTDSSYVSNVTHNDEHNTNEQDKSETQTVNETGSASENGESTTTDNKESTLNRSQENNLTGKETQTGSSSAHTTGEQRSTQDNNTRTESIGKQVEEYVLERKGNIGVNPASYEIDHHINTQKVLKRIYEMFFNECEDLFMMVY